MQNFDDESKDSRGLASSKCPPKRLVNFQREYCIDEDVFWPEEEGRHIAEMNKTSAIYRATVLFGSEAIEDFVHKYEQEHRTPFNKLGRSEFLRRARMMPPEKPESNASAFSQWIYSLYSNAYGNDEDRERGKVIEQRILDLRRQAACSIDNDFLRSIRSDWTLAHNGLHLNDSAKVKYLEINHLSVNGEPLRVSPDLLYHNALHSEVIIVEIKNSKRQIPTNLWPNLWAQLWCYSQLEIAKSAKKLTVVGEVWDERGRAWGEEPRLFLRASVRRDPRAPAYDQFFRELFDIYRGNC